jgi:hypothetical protein
MLSANIRPFSIVCSLFNPKADLHYRRCYPSVTTCSFICNKACGYGGITVPISSPETKYKNISVITVFYCAGECGGTLEECHRLGEAGAVAGVFSIFLKIIRIQYLRTKRKPSTPSASRHFSNVCPSVKIAKQY